MLRTQTLLMYCFTTCSSKQIQSNDSCSAYFLLFLFPIAPPPIATISPPGGTPTAGEPFSLTCSVTLADGGSLTDDLLVHWEAPVDINMASAIQVLTADSTVTRTSTLTFTPVRTSHGGKYTCKATTTGGKDMSTKALTVQSKKRSIFLCLA